MRYLLDKHPQGKEPETRSLLESVNPITFDGLDSEAIKQALHTHGTAGPSVSDAHDWRKLCSSLMSAFDSLSITLASIGCSIATAKVNPDGLSAFVACRLIV